MAHQTVDTVSWGAHALGAADKRTLPCSAELEAYDLQPISILFVQAKAHPLCPCEREKEGGGGKGGGVGGEARTIQVACGARFTSTQQHLGSIMLLISHHDRHDAGLIADGSHMRSTRAEDIGLHQGRVCHRMNGLTQRHSSSLARALWCSLKGMATCSNVCGLLMRASYRGL